MADKALADGSPEAMIKEMNGLMAQAIREKFRKVLEARQNKDKSVEDGREFCGGLCDLHPLCRGHPHFHRDWRRPSS